MNSFMDVIILTELLIGSTNDISTLLTNQQIVIMGLRDPISIRIILLIKFQFKTKAKRQLLYCTDSCVLKYYISVPYS